MDPGSSDNKVSDQAEPKHVDEIDIFRDTPLRYMGQLDALKFIAKRLEFIVVSTIK